MAFDFESWLARVSAGSEAWHASDFDRLFELEADAYRPSPNELAELVREFCERSGELPNRVGRDGAGRLLWYLMGGGAQIWLQIREARADRAIEAVLSLKCLYDELFAKELTDPEDAATTVAHPLGTACYMLWDMDGGLGSIPLLGAPNHLVDPCFDVLEYALTVHNPACWLSALHGLGHSVSAAPERVRTLIQGFLARHDRIPHHLMRYAEATMSGRVL